MSNNTIYANVDSHMVGSGGGHVLLAVAAGSTAQFNSGTTLPCRVMYLGASSSNNVRFGINSSVNVSLGAPVPTVSVGDTSPAPLELPIDDVSKIWIFASTVASVGCTYRY